VPSASAAPPAAEAPRAGQPLAPDYRLSLATVN